MSHASTVNAAFNLIVHGSFQLLTEINEVLLEAILISIIGVSDFHLVQNTFFLKVDHKFLLR